MISQNSGAAKCDCGAALEFAAITCGICWRRDWIMELSIKLQSLEPDGWPANTPAVLKEIFAVLSPEWTPKRDFELTILSLTREACDG